MVRSFSLWEKWLDRNALGQNYAIGLFSAENSKFEYSFSKDRLFVLYRCLNTLEYSRQSVHDNACGRAIRRQEGIVEDLHSYLKNLRGSASYWRTAHKELIAFICCLGPPTWFLTLSYNDLNWIDMRKSLLIADGRLDEDPCLLNIDEVQRLIELYPVVLSRHFSRRVDACMKQIKRNDDLLGGKVIDF